MGNMEEKTDLPKGSGDQEELAVVIGKNITRLRRLSNMTQLELAEKLNYSDKSVSKWEQGNGIPDVRILVRLADLFNVSVDDLVREHKEKPVMPRRERKLKRLIVTLCASGLCWLLAVVCFVLIGIFAPHVEQKWLAFVYAVPATAIVIIVFSAIWQWKIARIVSISVLVWTVLTCIYLTAYVCGANWWLVFLIGIPLQILALVFFGVGKRFHFFKE